MTPPAQPARGLAARSLSVLVAELQLVVIVLLAQVIAHIQDAINPSAWKPIDTIIIHWGDGDWLGWSHNDTTGLPPELSTLLGYVCVLALMALLVAWLPIRRSHGWTVLPRRRRIATIAMAAFVGIAAPMLVIVLLPPLPPEVWWPIDTARPISWGLASGLSEVVLQSPDGLTPCSPGALLMGVASVLITWLVWRIGTLRLVRAPAPPMARPTVEEPPDPAER